MKFSELYEKKMEDILKPAEVKTTWFIQDPKKTDHQSSVDKTLYTDRKEAEKKAKELGLEIEVWLGLKGRGEGPYDKPKKYKVK